MPIYIFFYEPWQCYVCYTESDGDVVDQASTYEEADLLVRLYNVAEFHVG